MLVELSISWIDVCGLLVSFLNLVALVAFSYLTHRLSNDVQGVFASFTLNQIELSHMSFNITNKSKFEVEVLSKVWTKVNNRIFAFNKGFYGDDTNWILQAFTTGGGHFDLKNMIDEEGKNLDNYVIENKVDTINFNVQIKYRKVGSRKWKKSSPQIFIYNFKNRAFWLNV